MNSDEVIKNVSLIEKENLCISCGLCGAICPRATISYSLKSGLYVPVIDENMCNNCGLCLDICPGRGCDYNSLYKLAGAETHVNMWTGSCLTAVTAVTKDEEVLKNSTSGGVVTTLVKSLLKKGKYDAAFLVNSYNYNDATYSEYFDKTSDFSKTGGSRYIPVLHTEAVRYILNEKNKRVILVGTSCFIEGVCRLIKRYKLSRENYLLIGLFCDKTMSYNVYDYFKGFEKKKELTELLFRTKKSGGWPGNVALKYADNTEKIISRSERMMVKDYFAPERCLYCLDKLNQFADISVGDNYTKKNSDSKGSSSVLIRTERAQSLWEDEKFLFDTWESEFNDIIRSQKMDEKQANLAWQKKAPDLFLRNTEFDNVELTNNLVDEYIEKIRKAKLGADEKYTDICKELIPVRIKKRKKLIVKIKLVIKRILCLMKR